MCNSQLWNKDLDQWDFVEASATQGDITESEWPTKCDMDG